MAKQKADIKQTTDPELPVAEFPTSPLSMLDEPAPTFTIGADSAFGLQCIFMIHRAAQNNAALSDAQRAAIDDRARLFDLYEEALRTKGQ